MINEIVLFQSNTSSTTIEVRVEEETIWLTQAQIVNLFESSKANISEHIKNIYQTNELFENATVRVFRTVREKWFAFSKFELDALDILMKLDS